MLKVQNISKSYYHKPILKNISFEVEKGEVIAVLGKNGVGKTTLLKILSGLTTPDCGKIIINSIELNKFDPNSRKDFFYMGHEPGFYSVYTCKENLTLCASLYGLTKMESEIDDAIEKVGLRNNIKTPIQFFSQGMLQRLKVAAASIVPWKLLFFDEPFNGLDEKGISMLESFIKHWIKQQRTMIFVCHNFDWVKEKCNRSIVLDNAKISNENSFMNENNFLTS